MIKQFLLVSVLLMGSLPHNGAGVTVLPEIPRPNLTVAQVLVIAQAHLGADHGRFTLVGVDWQRASDFKPVFSDAQYSPAGDEPDQFSWFITYVYKDEAIAKALADLGIKREFNAVRIIRVKANGQIGAMIGFRA